MNSKSRLGLYCFLCGFLGLAYEVYFLRIQKFFLGTGILQDNFVIGGVLLVWALGNTFSQQTIVALKQKRWIANGLIILFSVVSSTGCIMAIKELGIPIVFHYLHFSLFLLLPLYWVVGVVCPESVRKRPESTSFFFAMATLGSLMGILFASLALYFVLDLNHLSFLLVLVLGAFLLFGLKETKVGAGFAIIFSLLLNFYGVNTPRRKLTGQSLYEVIDLPKAKALSINSTRFSSVLGNENTSSAYNEAIHRYLLLGKRKRSVLVLGAGGMGISSKNQHHEYHFVDIDPKLESVVKEKFNPRAQGSLTVGDARQFVETTDRSFDVIVLDVFRHGSLEVPPYLLSFEFFKLVKSKLKSQGAFAFNIVHEKLLGQQVWSKRLQNTLSHVFESCYYLPMSSTNFLDRKGRPMSSLAICSEGVRDEKVFSDLSVSGP